MCVGLPVALPWCCPPLSRTAGQGHFHHPGILKKRESVRGGLQTVFSSCYPNDQRGNSQGCVSVTNCCTSWGVQWILRFLNFSHRVRVSYILGPEGDPSGASLLAGPPAIPYGARLRLVLTLLLLLLFVRFCASTRMMTGKLQCDNSITSTKWYEVKTPKKKDLRRKWNDSFLACQQSYINDLPLTSVLYLIEEQFNPYYFDNAHAHKSQ